MEDDDWLKEHHHKAAATRFAIGRFIQTFSTVETVMRHFFALEIKLDMRFYHQALPHDFAMLCTAVHEVFDRTLETDDKKKELKTLIARARKLNDLRVKVVHGEWEISMTELYPMFRART
jgi:hypothetical protein